MLFVGIHVSFGGVYLPGVIQEQGWTSKVEVMKNLAHKEGISITEEEMPGLKMQVFEATVFEGTWQDVLAIK